MKFFFRSGFPRDVFTAPVGLIYDLPGGGRSRSLQPLPLRGGGDVSTDRQGHGCWTALFPLFRGERQLPAGDGLSFKLTLGILSRDPLIFSKRTPREPTGTLGHRACLPSAFNLPPRTSRILPPQNCNIFSVSSVLKQAKQIMSLVLLEKATNRCGPQCKWLATHTSSIFCPVLHCKYVCSISRY